MAWVWTDQPDDKDSFFTTYDRKYSTLRPYLLMGPAPIPPEAGSAILNARRYSAESVRRYGCLPAASDERVIHNRLRSVLLNNVSKDEVQLYPMTVQAKGKDLAEFFAVVPLNEVTCTDIARSEITGWIVPGKVADMYRSITHFEGCLGNLNIARDSVVGHVVVSDSLKAALEAAGEPGVYFSRPENMKTYMN